ncbi:S-layer family protein [Acidipila sp. EB88]|uniref:beta strand repeat-containing protein n=1 Tax=Acidipila sp. EB88 TaxID=2305226 RepID=UPI000F5FD629|nr:choice-of-anchor D domain-containing protein [Acidipila sp. EB88]
MFAVVALRCVALLCVLLAGGSTAMGAPLQEDARPPTPAARLADTPPQHNTTPAAAQQQRDRAFLRHRGIGSTLPPGTTAQRDAPLSRLAAARQQQRQHWPSSASPAQGDIAGDTTQPGKVLAATSPATATPNAVTLAWQPAGPVQLSTAAYGLVTGRVSSLAVDPNDASGNTVYLGATGGGVWKSTNAAGAAAGVSFTPLTDDLAVFANSLTSLPSLSIGALTVQPGNAQVLLAGTGDPNDALDSYYGVGILRSTNGGVTWSLVQQSSDSGVSGINYSMQGVGFAGFAWGTSNTNFVVAAASQSLEGLLVNTSFASSAETGLYYSSDAGQTWHLATITDGANEVVQSTNPPSSPPGNAATAVVWNPKRSLFLAAIRFHGYYSSPDGITWTRLANQPGANLTLANCPTRPGASGSSSCPIFRGALAVQPTTGDTFALTTDISNLDQGLYQDVCSTSGLAVSSCASSTIAFGTRIADTAIEASDGTIPEGDYNLALSAVSSQQDTILFAGTEDIFRCSLANSCAWRNTTNNQTCAAAMVAPSIHAIDSTDGVNGLLYFGNDGGLWRSSDTVSQTGSACASTDSSHFQNLNAGIGSLAEISHFAASPSNPALVLAGMGGFGVVGSESAAAQAGTGAWQQLLTGEGSFVAIDPNTPANWYADAGPGLSIFSCPGGANCSSSTFGTEPVIDRSDIEDDADYFLDPAPWMLDPLNPANIIVGTCRMWLGPATGGWSSSNLLSGMLDGDHDSFCDGNATLRAVGAGGSYNSPQGGEQVYAGMGGPLDGGSIVAGHVYGATVPQAGGMVAWTDLWRNPVTSTSPSSQFNSGGEAISAITVDPHDATGKTLYVGIGGFPSGQSGVVYQSVDAGAHWSNITNSLPFGPVSSIVVDPSTAGTVYVGGDFGVYSTTSVGTCTSSTQNCWSELGSGLPNAPVTDLKLVFSGSNAVLEAATYGRGIWTYGVTAAANTTTATLSPTSYTFPAQGVGSTSTTTAGFTLKNTGTAALSVSQVATTPSDYAQTNQCGTTLAAGASCTITVSFTPTTTGDRPGTLTVRGNVPSGAVTATLDGTGLTPGAISLTPATLTFPTTTTGSSSAAMTATAKNTGGAPVQINSLAIAGTNSADFTLGSGGTCAGMLASGASCTIPVVFSPTQTGARTAQLQLAAAATGSPFLVSLSGNAVAPASVSLSPVSLSFASTAQGTTTAAQTITASNTGGVAAQLGTPSVTSDYALTANTCGTTLSAGTSCTVSIAFAPTATGSRPGLFTLPAPGNTNGYVTAPLSGTGLAPPMVAFAPASLSFGAEQQNTTSAAMTLTVTNSAGSTAQLGAPTITGDFTIASNTCPATLPVGSSCTLTVTFTPSQLGSRTGTVSFLVNNNSVSANLTGNGTAPPLLAFSPASLSFAATADNSTSAPQSATVTNNGGNPAQISSSSIAGPFAIASTTCPSPPATLAASAACTLQVTFTPPAAAAYTGTATLAGNFSNTPASLALFGQGAPPPAASLAPQSLTFPDTPQGAVAPSQTITISSSGGVAVTLGIPSASTSDYQVAGNTCAATLAPGSTCALQIAFHPSKPGARSATLTVPGNMAGGQLTASLNGNGLAPGALALAPTSLAFGSAVIGTTSAAQTVTVTNSGGVAISPGTATTTGDYSITSNTCGASLAPSQSCSVAVVFKPTAAGDRPGQLTLPGDGSEAVAVATLDGAGTTAGQLSFMPSSLAFGTVAVGSSGTATTSVTNSGGTAVHLGSLAASGDFIVSGGTCTTAAAVAASGGSCTVAITFTPTAVGSRTGTLTLQNDGSPAMAQAGLAGVGAAPGNVALSPASLAFGSVVLNTTSAAQTITATNSGGVAVTLNTATVTGSSYSIAGNNCGSTLAAGASCSVQITFTPTTAGAASGSFALSGQYNGSPATVPLNGTGVTAGALTFTPNPVTFGSVATGAQTTLPVTVQNTGGTAVTLGTPSTSSSYSVTSQCGSTLAPLASCLLHVTFAPTSTGSVPGLLTFPASVAGGSATDALAGQGVAPAALVATPAALTFAGTAVGATSAAQPVTFSNTGGVAASINPPAVSSSDYSITSSTCGSSLAPGSSCAVSVAFNPSAAGDRDGSLSLTSSAEGGPASTVPLDGTGLAAAQLAFSPPSLDFGSQADNTTSAAQSLTLLNSGGVSTTLAVPVLTGQYAITGNTCGTSLGAGASCRIAVKFVPTGSGSQAGSLSISSQSGSLHASAALTGNALALVLNPTALSFTPAIAVGTSSASQDISIENVGTATITLEPPSVTGDFAVSGTSCGTELAPNSSCAVLITFTPTAGGTRTGTFTESDGTATGITQLTGTGLSPATDTLSPTSLSFPGTPVNTASAALSATLTNSGEAVLSQISVQTTGPFTAANNCGASLGGHLACSIAVQFTPTAVGAVTGTLVVADAQRTQSIALSGTGNAPPEAFASPSSLNFGSYAQGIATPPQSVTISNQGASPMTGVAFATTGTDFAISSTTCGATLTSGSSCQVSVVFTPGVIGNRVGALTVTSSTLAAPLTVSLSGAGEDFELTVLGAATSVVTPGQTATYNLQITPVGASAGSLAITCAGAPANAVCTPNPQTITIANGADGSIVLSVATAAATAASTHSSIAPGSSAPWSWLNAHRGMAAVALLCPVLLVPRRRRQRLLLLLATAALLATPLACGVHASGVSIGGSGGTGGGTASSGTYTLTVSATFPGAQRIATVQLVVQ